MSYPELPKVRERRQWMHGRREYYYKASEVYAKLMTQPCFALNGGHKIRAALREHLHGYGRLYMSPPGQLHDPCYDKQFLDTFVNYECPREQACRPDHAFVERYNWQSVLYAARHIPFICPICGSTDNPLGTKDCSFPWDIGEQIVCIKCWEAYAWKLDDRIDEIETAITKLNKGIRDVQERKRNAAQRTPAAAGVAGA